MRHINKHKIALCLILVLVVCSMPIISYATSTQDKLNAAQQEKEQLEKCSRKQKKNLAS